MSSLISFQRTVAKALLVLCFAQVPILMALAWALGQPTILTGVVVALLAGVPMLFWSLGRPIRWTAFALAVSLVGQTSVLVALMAGHPWQVEMHFYYFAVLAMLSGFCDWRVLLVTASLVAGHHLSLNWLLPAAVYPGGTNLLRVMVHALVVVVETVMLVGIGETIRGAFREADTARQQAEQVALQLEQAAMDRDRELVSTTDRSDRLRELLDQFQNEMVASTDILRSAAEELQVDADHLGRAATHANTQSTTAVVATEDTNRKVQSAAQAGEELAVTISEVGSNAATSSSLANAAVAEAAKTSAAIDELAGVAHEIDKVTDLITAIASQTNLLALNATIEAARAGDAGRGFAVVAQEVKALAGQTAAATQEIAQRIAAMKNATGRSVEAIAAISGTIRELDLSSARIAAAVEQQAMAAHEIAGNAASASESVLKVNNAMSEIESVVDETSRAAHKLGTAATNVTKQTRTIQDRVRNLRENVQAMHA